MSAMAEKPIPGADPPGEGRRMGDPAVIRLTRLVKVLAILCVLLIPISAVFSTVAVLAARDAQDAVNATTMNSATIDELCQVAKNQRRTLTLSVQNTKDYLKSPVAKENPGFSAYIEQVSLPQTIQRVKTERLPKSCRSRVEEPE